MVNKVFNILLGITAVSAVQVGFVAPPSISYVYTRHHVPSTHNLAPTPYQPVQVFHPTLHHPQPAPINYNHPPLPLPYVVERDIKGPQGNSFEKAESSDYGEQHNSAHGEQESKGYRTEDQHAKGETGHYNKDHHDGYYQTTKGGKKGHHDIADAHGKHYESGKSYKGGDHGHKKHSSKGEDVTGYHKVFHKDEIKTDHDFYDIADRSGHNKKHGYKKASHDSEEGDHKEGGNHDSGSEENNFNKSDFHDKDDSDAGVYKYSVEEGHDSDYQHEEETAHNNDGVYGKEYANEDYNGEYEDE